MKIIQEIIEIVWTYYRLLNSLTLLVLFKEHFPRNEYAGKLKKKFMEEKGTNGYHHRRDNRKT